MADIRPGTQAILDKIEDQLGGAMMDIDLLASQDILLDPELLALADDIEGVLDYKNDWVQIEGEL